MLRFVRPLSLLLLVLLSSGCATFRAKQWAQFHADGPSQGSTTADSTYALQPSWSVEIGPVTYSSPAIGEDGTIYVGTANRELVAVNPDGTEKWRRALPGAVVGALSVITASPAVGADGNIYVISTVNVEIRDHTTNTTRRVITSTLHSIEPDGDLRWSRPFPENRFTTSSPKTWGSGQNVYVFVYAPDELFIFDQLGTVVHRQDVVAYGSHTICGGSSIFEILADFFSSAFSCISFSFPPCKFDPSGFPPPYEAFGWLEPTVAIVDYPKFADQPIVVVVGKYAIVAFRWNSPDLSYLWSEEYGEDCGDNDTKDLSSPAVFASGTLAVARKDGHVRTYDVETGAKLWDYDAKEPVMATPASFGRQVYVVSVRHLHVLDYNGELLHQFELPEQSVASPALSADLVYVNATGGLYTFTSNLESYFKYGPVKGGLSSPAIAKDGTVYVMDRNRKLWAFPGR